MMRALAMLALLASCSSSGDGAYDYASSKGAALYQDQCQVCHGETGEGGLGPALRDSKRSEDDLSKIIAMRMPANNPGQCTGECASELAAFIKDGLTTKALRCDKVGPGPRRLRLLTRREYRATVRDVLGMPAMTCARATDCGYRDTCTAGACEASACDAQTFVYDPGGRTSAAACDNCVATYGEKLFRRPLTDDEKQTYGALAGTTALADAAGIEKWARLLVADPRARVQVGEFAAQWTGATNVLTVDKRTDRERARRRDRKLR